MSVIMPGSYDPVTLGHVEMIRRVAEREDEAEPTAKKIIRAIERNTIFAGIPFGYHFIRFWQAILPLRVFDIIFGTIFGIYRTMDHFTGRGN